MSRIKYALLLIESYKAHKEMIGDKDFSNNDAGTRKILKELRSVFYDSTRPADACSMGKFRVI